MTSTRPQTSGRQAARLDGARSRERILDEAERLFAEKGFSGTGIAAISRESGLPASSIYWFFASKRELMMAVVERASERFLSELEEPDASGNPLSLRRMFERGLSTFGARIPDFLRLRFLLGLEQSAAQPEVEESFREMNGRINALVSRAIEVSLGERAGAQRKRIAAELAPLALAMGNGAMINLYVEPDSVDAERLPEDLELAILALAESRMRKDQP